MALTIIIYAGKICRNTCQTTMKNHPTVLNLVARIGNSMNKSYRQFDGVMSKTFLEFLKRTKFY